MMAIHGLPKDKGLDLILHTPGGGIAAAESIVDYLHRMFGNDIRAVIPHLAMSAGTMIACACKSIVLAKHSNLGPIDPQLNGLPAAAVKEELERALNEIKADPASLSVWQFI
jgi:ClpP class serine protease